MYRYTLIKHRLGILMWDVLDSMLHQFCFISELLITITALL